jgi:hypothetical protein
MNFTPRKLTQIAANYVGSSPIKVQKSIIIVSVFEKFFFNRSVIIITIKKNEVDYFWLFKY